MNKLVEKLREAPMRLSPVKLYFESHSGWTTRQSPISGDWEIVDGNGWALATLAYDYRFTCNATNYFRAKLLASAPELYEYVESSASNGCATAKALIDKITART